MHHYRTKIAALIILKLKDQITHDQQIELDAYAGLSAENALLVQELTNTRNLLSNMDIMPDIDVQAAWKQLAQRCDIKPRPVVRKMVIRWAAAVLFIAAGVSIWYYNRPVKNYVLSIASVPIIAPAQQKDTAWKEEQSMLILPDGKQIAFDTLRNGPFRLDAQTVLIKKDSLLQYTYRPPKEGPPPSPVFYSMYIGRQKQYRVILSDSSTIWMNSESGCRFPIDMAVNRQINLYGEALLDVNANLLHPFRVDIMDLPTDTSIKGTVEVHGTEFNIKAYNNEQAKVTLVRGKLKIITNADMALLSARQAAVIDNRSKKIRAFSIRSKRASIVAWTEGYFSFENDSIGTIVKELERWYNKKITYTGTPSIMTPGLYMPRKSKLTDILAVLGKNYNLTFDIQNPIRPSFDK